MRYQDENSICTGKEEEEEEEQWTKLVFFT
jgi:hypothetical protein